SNDGWTRRDSASCRQLLLLWIHMIAKPVRLGRKAVQQRSDRAPVGVDGHLTCEFPKVLARPPPVVRETYRVAAVIPFDSLRTKRVVAPVPDTARVPARRIIDRRVRPHLIHDHALLGGASGAADIVRG